MHYGDKRDLGTFEYQMLSQGSNQSVKEFHRTVYQHLSLLLRTVSLMELDEEAHRALKKMFRDKVLDTLIYVAPPDLPSALNICQKMEIQKYRFMHAISLGHSHSINTTTPAPQFVSSGFRQSPQAFLRNRPFQNRQGPQQQN